jgi:hypothetical protein
MLDDQSPAVSTSRCIIIKGQSFEQRKSKLISKFLMDDGALAKVQLLSCMNRVPMVLARVSPGDSRSGCIGMDCERRTVERKKKGVWDVTLDSR